MSTRYIVLYIYTFESFYKLSYNIKYSYLDMNTWYYMTVCKNSQKCNYKVL